MIVDLDEAPVMVLALLEEKLYDRQAPARPIWPSTWPVFNRLIERHDKRASVYREIATSGITRQQFWLLLEQIVHTGSFGTEQNHAVLRADYEELTALNDDISTVSMQLAEMLERRSRRAALIDESSHFHCERMRIYR